MITSWIVWKFRYPPSITSISLWSIATVDLFKGIFNIIITALRKLFGDLLNSLPKDIEYFMILILFIETLSPRISLFIMGSLKLLISACLEKSIIAIWPKIYQLKELPFILLLSFKAKVKATQKLMYFRLGLWYTD